MNPIQQYEAHVAGLHTQADSYARHFGLDPRGAHNGQWDAFRHAYVSAELTCI